MKRSTFVIVLTGLLVLGANVSVVRGQSGLIAHWELSQNGNDNSGNGHHLVNHNVKFSQENSAQFNGVDSWLELPIDSVPDLWKNGITISAWINTQQQLQDVIGDVLSCYNLTTRTGINLSIMNYAGITNSQSNHRNVFFGMDDGSKIAAWTSCGRPGNSQYVRSLTVFDGDLYASTWEPDVSDRGHVYRYAGDQKWIDCGAPSKANCIAAMAVYNGHLYVGSELYSGGGSSLPLSENENHGGTVYRYEGGSKWSSMGRIADVRAISALTEFDGKLYAGTGSTGSWRDTPRTRGMYRFDGPNSWVDCGCPDLRVVHLGVHNGHLYGLSYDDGGFFEYMGGKNWNRLGPIPKTTQAYSMVVYEGAVHVGTWPTGSVYRLDGSQQWSFQGRLGEEKEVMGISVYNGQLFAGTLPFADVYRYQGGTRWTTTGRLDNTPDVKYRRAWSMAVFDGKLFCGVLPSGQVLSLEVGKSVTHDRALPSGWQHLTAVRRDSQLQLFINGKMVSTSSEFDKSRFKKPSGTALRIGFGQHDYFNGHMKDVRIYDRALDVREIRRIAKTK
ncbi:MAG: LamG domain-containing protein [Planctomycetaceae bacterium]|nr:LamG domain-containing protein [Planctomycetaceae bacterium]